jgi:hypothetical protein
MFVVFALFWRLFVAAGNLPAECLILFVSVILAADCW